ncbi:myosin-binding protein 2-like [Salvia miltiorrhiza]|uniref:myosin-binding protein 2-like n=1 Tax=Salvia miltiorrhiza TaxID=226208 RepID=UPI0025AD6E0D|nr:myosin-binding protein 2-like [Salvia miltiorrhiza]
MAGNKFASMLHKNCPRIIVILVYALLEWILILLLLINSFFSHLIAKFAKFFGLKPSCTWCSTLSNSKRNPHFDHVCEAHGAQISNLRFCSAHNKLADSHHLCTRCSPALAFFTGMSMSESENASPQGGDCRCWCCDDQILTTSLYPHQSLIFKPTWDFLLEYVDKHKLQSEANLVKKEIDDVGKKAEIVEDSNLEVQEWDSSQTTDDPSSLGCNEDVYIADMNAELMDYDRFICIELIDTDAVALTLTNTSQQGIGSNRAAKQLNVEAELEEEREAAAEAAKETMAMITKLQEEKAAMQMEAAQYQRMMEEQAEYDQEALQLLNDLITKRDKENKQLHKGLQIYKSHSTQMEDASLAELDQERVSILQQVKHLEAKLPLFEELGHVYERLQALEADSDFLKHCIRSMSKGSQGMALLQEILQHLRDLKSVNQLPHIPLSEIEQDHPQFSSP